MSNAKKLTLFQKLLEIQKEIRGLAKDKKGNNYTYVTGNKLFSFVRPLMDKHGIILKQEVISIDNERMDYKVGIGTQYEKEKSEVLSKVMMRFTWVDTESGEKDENMFGANGQNDWEKGLGSALTYAERYFVLKYFHIPTDEDDVDNPERKNTPEPTKQAAPTQKPWLNKTDKSGAQTKEWGYVLAGINNGKVKTIADVLKVYSVNKQNQEEITILINQKNGKSN